MELTNEFQNKIKSLQIYIDRNFKKYPIEIQVKGIKLAKVPHFQILIQGRILVFENEGSAWTFVDGIYTALQLLETRIIE